MCLLVDLVTKMNRLFIKTRMLHLFNTSHMVTQDHSIVTETNRLFAKTRMLQLFNTSHMVTQDHSIWGYMPVSDIVVLAR